MAIKYTVGDNWNSGFIGNMVVPADSQALHGWTLEFDASFTITDIWGAEIVSHVGNHYVVKNESWDAAIAAGQSVKFGFNADWPAIHTAPSGFVLNGIAIKGI